MPEDKSPLNEKQRKLSAFLVEKRGTKVTMSAIEQATGWGTSTVKTYVTKGKLDDYIQAAGDGKFHVRDAPASDWALYQALTQKSDALSDVPALQNPLAISLARRARDNLTLALETFNRAGLVNRLDAAILLFCTAWEQLLKAEHVEENGEESIYRPQVQNKRRETKGFSEMLKARVEHTDVLCRHLQFLQELRNEAAHFIVPEIGSPISNVLQSGVVHFGHRFKELTGGRLFPSTSAGLLALVAEPEHASFASLKQVYGELTAKEILEVSTSVEDRIKAEDDSAFAVPIGTRLEFRKDGSPIHVVLNAATSGAGPTVTVTKNVSVDQTHPYIATDVCRRIEARIGEKFSTYHLAAINDQWDFKGGNNEWHRRAHARVGSGVYSEALVDRVAKALRDDPDFLNKAMEKRRKKLNRARSRKKRLY